MGFTLNSHALISNYDLADSNNFDVRIDGANINDYFSYAGIAVGDINNNSKPDLFISARTDYNSRADSGSIYIFLDTTIDALSSGSIIDLQSNSSYFLRIDGSDNGGANGHLGAGSMIIDDVNNDGKDDLITEHGRADYGGADSGSVYVIDNAIINSFTGTGNTMDIATSTSYTLRIDGENVNDRLGGGIDDTLHTDIVGGSDKDLILGAYAYDSYRGYVYIIDGDILTPLLSGTGNILDLGNSTSYSIRYSAAAQNDHLGRLSKVADYNNDGDIDLILTAKQSDFNGADSGSVYLIDNSLFTAYSGTGNNVSLGTSTNFSIRYDGAGSGDNIGWGDAELIDINGNDLVDIVLAADLADTNGNDSGALYVLYDSIIDDYSGTGNVVVMSNTSNFNLRIDGAGAGSEIGYVSVSLVDVDDDTYPDLMVHGITSFNSRANSGSVYIIPNNKFSGYTNTANIITLADTNNYDYRFDGGSATGYLGYNATLPYDFNGDGIIDLVLGEIYGTNNTVSRSGSVYIIYGGSNVANLISDGLEAFSIDDISNYEIPFHVGNNTVFVKKSGLIVSDTLTNFPYLSSLDWTAVFGGSDLVNAKSFINGLTSAPGAASTMNLYVPIPLNYSSNQVTICPGVTSLSQVSLDCAGAIMYTEADANVSIVVINGQSYWRISGLTDAGGIATLQALAATGDSIVVALIIGFILLIISSSKFFKLLSTQKNF